MAKRIMTERAAVDLALALKCAGRLREDRLVNAGVSKADVIRVARKAEARFVNDAIRKMGPAPRTQQ